MRTYLNLRYQTPLPVLLVQVLSVKERIEEIQGRDVCPCSQQLLIYKGKVLKDETTLEENSVVENSFLVVMLTKVHHFLCAFLSMHYFWRENSVAENYYQLIRSVTLDIFLVIYLSCFLFRRKQQLLQSPLLLQLHRCIETFL